MKQWSRACVLAGCAVLAASVLAQQWKAEVPAVEKAGVYRVVLSPELVGLSQQDLRDVRLQNSAGVETPYLLNVEQREVGRGEYHDFRILRNERLGKQTFLELECPHRGFVVDDIHLRIRNAEVEKEVTLTGSDDGKDWFFIKADIMLLGDNDDRTTTLRMLRLPASDYARYRLVINDSATAPLQILGAQWFTYGTEGGVFETDNTVRWTRKEERGATRITVACPRMILVDRVVLQVGDGTKFHRPVRIEQMVSVTTGRGRKRRTVQHKEVVASSHISSAERSPWDLPGLRLDSFDIVIDNGDDQPLAISDIRFLQLQRSLLAELKPGQHYTITTGDPKKQAPQYDLAHFKEQLPAPIATLNHGPLIALPPAAQQGPTIAPSRWWIWAGLVAVLGLVGFMAVRMLREPPTTT